MPNLALADLPLARRDEIARRLAGGRAVVSAALASEFSVSEDAIRRDLRALAAQGRCRRVYGGALPITQALTPMTARMSQAQDRKEALALAAARFIKPGEFLFLDSGSTNLALVEFLPDDSELTVATNSIEIAAAVLRRQAPQLIVVGGVVNPIVGGCVDAAAIQGVSQMNIDRCFLGACSAAATSGISAFDAADAAFKRAVLANSQRSLVLLTNEKFDARAPYRIATLDRIDRLVVEHDAPEQCIDALARAGADIVTADSCDSPK